MFPQPPPVPGADPEVRYGVTLLAPWRLVVEETDEGTKITLGDQISALLHAGQQ